MAVTGFNGVTGADGAFANITTIRQPLRQLGGVAIERLLAMIDGAPASECRVIVETQMVIAETTVPGLTQPETVLVPVFRG
jgi:LacI family transcriptional regulator